jgi:hypothetical protein
MARLSFNHLSRLSIRAGYRLAPKDFGAGSLCYFGDEQHWIYLITNRSVIALSTRVRSFSNSASDRVDPIFINGNVVTVTCENGFGTAKPSQELNRQYAEYSISSGMRGTWHLCDR